MKGTVYFCKRVKSDFDSSSNEHLPDRGTPHVCKQSSLARAGNAEPGGLPKFFSYPLAWNHPRDNTILLGKTEVPESKRQSRGTELMSNDEEEEEAARSCPAHRLWHTPSCSRPQNAKTPALWLSNTPLYFSVYLCFSPSKSFIVSDKIH